eukprot:maker-scaffold334_size202906-snap-gene-1.34 protein:Tk08975 transcript:maker-scaffold334_size202906-snap-gene-1.34-mRNA-1 annotation:"---NA---"
MSYYQARTHSHALPTFCFIGYRDNHGRYTAIDPRAGEAANRVHITNFVAMNFYVQLGNYSLSLMADNGAWVQMPSATIQSAFDFARPMFRCGNNAVYLYVWEHRGDSCLDVKVRLNLRGLPPRQPRALDVFVALAPFVAAPPSLRPTPTPDRLPTALAPYVATLPSSRPSPTPDRPPPDSLRGPQPLLFSLSDLGTTPIGFPRSRGLGGALWRPCELVLRN